MFESSEELSETCEKINSTSAIVWSSYKASATLQNEALLDNPRLSSILEKGKTHSSPIVRARHHCEPMLVDS